MRLTSCSCLTVIVYKKIKANRLYCSAKAGYLMHAFSGIFTGRKAVKRESHEFATGI